MAKQTVPPLPLPKGWPQKVRSAAIHAIALVRLALTTARYPAGTTFAGAGLPPAGTTNLSRHTWTTTGEDRNRAQTRWTSTPSSTSATTSATPCQLHALPRANAWPPYGRFSHRTAPEPKF
jgi:hypothetical protein